MNTVSLMCTDSLYMPSCPVLTDQEIGETQRKGNQCTQSVSSGR